VGLFGGRPPGASRSGRARGDAARRDRAGQGRGERRAWPRTVRARRQESVAPKSKVNFEQSSARQSRSHSRLRSEAERGRARGGTYDAFGLSSRRQHGGICAQALILPLPHNLMLPPPILDRAFALSSRRQHMEASMHRLKSYPCHTISCSHRLSSHPTLQPLSRLLLVAIFLADFVLAFVRPSRSLAAEASHQKRRPMHVAHLLVL